MSLVLKHIPASTLYVSRYGGWLESRFHFSFAEYYDPRRLEFGNLRVVNDDLVQPHSGFGPHPHKDMEIFTYVVDGELTHKDSMGKHETLKSGSIQYMSAGRGVTHSEMNNGNNLLRFLQIWIKPDQRGYDPNYGSRIFRREERHNKLHHVITSYNNYEGDESTKTGIIPIHQDANIYVSEADAGFKQQFLLEKKRQAYLVCIEGSLAITPSDLNEELIMKEKDALEIVGDNQQGVTIEFLAKEPKGAHFILMEMAKK